MKILAVDTSTKEIGVAVFENSCCLYENYALGERKYNKVIMDLVDKALEKAGVVIRDIDVFAATLGPGSFTGIRVGMSVMKAFAHATGKKFAGATTLEIMAFSAGKKAGNVYPALDARRQEVYSASFTCANGKASLKNGYRIMGIDKYVKQAAGGGTLAVLKHENPLEEIIKQGKIKVVEIDHIDMKSFCEILLKNKSRIKKENLYKLAPAYVRNPDVQEKQIKQKEKKK